jgi:hypothetical protein
MDVICIYNEEDVVYNIHMVLVDMVDEDEDLVDMVDEDEG